MPDEITAQDLLSSEGVLPTVEEAAAELPPPEITTADIGSGALGLSTGRTREQIIQEGIEPGRAGLVTSFQAGLVQDPQTKLQIFASRQFPDDPNAIERFGVVNGRLVFVNDDGKLQDVSGGFIDFLGEVAADVGPITGGAVGAAAGSRAGRPVAGAAAGAALGEAASRTAASFMFGEPVTPEGIALSAFLEGTLEAGGAAAGLGLRRFFRRKAVLDSIDLDKAKRMQREIKARTGIDLDIASVSQNARLLALKRYAANFPGEAAEIIRANEELVRGQTQQAVNRIVHSMANIPDPARIGNQGITAADAAIETVRQQRRRATKSLYDQAFAEKTQVDVTPVINQIDSALEAVPANSRRSGRLRSLRKEFFDEDGNQITSLEQLHNLNVDFKRRLNAPVGDPAAIGPERGLLQSVSGRLGGILNQSGNQVYSQAQQEWGRLTQELVRPLTDGIVGTLSKINSPQAARAAARMFTNSELISPVSMRRAKRAILGVERSNPDLQGTWRNLLGQYLSDQFDRALRNEGGNVAKKFRDAVFGTPNKRRIMIAAIGQEGLRDFNFLMRVLRRVAGGKQVKESGTATFQETRRQLEERAFPVTSAIVRGGRRERIFRGFEDRAIDEQAAMVANAITDPEKISQLRKLQKLSPSEARNAAVVGVLAAGLGAEIAEAQLLEDAPIGQTELPPVLQSQ